MADLDALDWQPQEPARTVLNVRQHDMKVAYANHCLLIHTPEELLLDFGIALPAAGAPPPQMNMLVTTRIVMTLPAARRLAAALSQAIERYESAAGATPPDSPPPAAPS